MIKERQIVMRRYAFGVDIGGTTVKIGLFETSGILSVNGKYRQELLRAADIF